MTDTAVRPSKLQLQNVQDVLKVFNEKVEAALRIQKCDETAIFLLFVINWWNVVTVLSKGQDENSSATYVAGWLKKKCEEHLNFNE